MRIELEHRQQFHRGHTKILQVGDLFDQAGIGAPLVGGYPRGRVPGEPGDVHLVDDGPRVGTFERQVAFPVVAARVGDHALHGNRSIIARQTCGAAVVSFRHLHRAAIGINEELARIKPAPPLGFKGSGDPVAVKLAGSDAWDEGMPVVVGAVMPGIERDDAGGFCIVRPVEEEQFDSGAVPGKYAEIDAARKDRGAKGRGIASVWFNGFAAGYAGCFGH